MDPKKVDAILDWKTPTSVKDIQTCMSFANFYHRFIQDYSRIVSPPTRLLKKDTKFKLTPTANKAFGTLKCAFTTALVITHFAPTLRCILETNTANFVVATVLSQTNSPGVLHPITFYSHKMATAEWNYEIYDEELLAIVR